MVFKKKTQKNTQTKQSDYSAHLLWPLCTSGGLKVAVLCQDSARRGGGDRIKGGSDPNQATTFCNNRFLKGGNSNKYCIMLKVA